MLLLVASAYQTTEAAMRRTGQSLSSYGRNVAGSSMVQRAQSWWNSPTEQETYSFAESTPSTGRMPSEVGRVPTSYGSMSWSAMSPSQADVMQQAWHESEQALQADMTRKQQQQSARYARAMKIVSRILMLVAAAKTTELAVTFGFEKYNEKIIQDIQRPNTLSYKLARIIQEKRWNDLKDMMLILVDELFANDINVALDNQIENRLNRQLNKLVDIKNAAIDGMKFTYFVYVLRLVSEHLNMFDTVETYMWYILDTWLYNHGQPLIGRTFNVIQVLKTSDPAMLSFYMKIIPEPKYYFGGNYYLDLLKMYIANIVSNQSELSKNQKECLTILINLAKPAGRLRTEEQKKVIDEIMLSLLPSSSKKNWIENYAFYTLQKLENIEQVINLLDPIQDQRLIIKLERYQQLEKEKIIQNVLFIDEAGLEKMINEKMQ